MEDYKLEKYISVDKLIKWIKNQKRLSKLYTILMLQDEPPENVDKIVRCGQCKHWKINPNNLYGGQCRFSECASIDHYCSMGEIKKK